MAGRARIGLILGALAAATIAIVACSKDDSGDVDRPPVAAVDDPGCKVEDAPALGACAPVDTVFTALVDAGAKDASKDAATDQEAGADASGAGDAGDASDASVDEDAAVAPTNDAGALPLTSCTLGSAHVVSCRQSNSMATALGNDGNAFAVAVGRKAAELVRFSGGAPTIEKLSDTYESGGAMKIVSTAQGEPFIVSSRGGSNIVYTQVGTAAAAPMTGVKGGLGSRSWNADGAIAITLTGTTAPQALVRRADGSISVENAPDVGSEPYRSAGITDDGKLFSVAIGEESVGSIAMEGFPRIGFPSARLSFAPSTPAGTPPVVALENSQLLVGIWDADLRGYVYAKVVGGIGLCARNDECDNTCGESGTEVSPGMTSVVRDRDGTVVVAYLRRELTRSRRYRRATGGLCDRIDCACGSEMENEHIQRAEIVILHVDPIARTVREQFVLALPAKQTKTGYDVGVDSNNGPQLSAELRDGHLLLTFAGNTSNGLPAMSLYDVRVR